MIAKTTSPRPFHRSCAGQFDTVARRLALRIERQRAWIEVRYAHLDRHEPVAAKLRPDDASGTVHGERSILGCSAGRDQASITGIGCLLLFDVERWIAQAEIAAAMSLEALLANMKPYQSRLHELRGFRGAVTTAANLRKVIDGSDLVTGKLKSRSRTPTRCAPRRR